LSNKSIDTKAEKDDVMINKKKIILMVIWLFLLIITNTQMVVEANSTATVKVDILNIRSGPGIEYEVKSKAKRGDKFAILEEKESWVKLKLTDSEGWVASWLIEKNQASENSSSTKQSKTIESKVSNLNVRSGPSTTFAIVDKIQPDTYYSILDVEGDWIKIQLSQNKSGWVANWLIKETIETPSVETTERDKVIIEATILNVRSTPSTSSSIIDKLKKGDVVEVLDIKDGWYQINKQNNKGWIASQYASSASNSTQEKSPNNSNEVMANTPTVTILNPGTNLREGPSTSYKVVARADEGEQFPIIDTTGDWYQIKLANGNKAYIAGWIVSVKGIDSNISHGLSNVLNGKTIVLDAGHGGNDQGATGTHFRSVEKDLNLSIANLLKKKLEAAGANVVMTRSTDIKIPLQGRVDIAIYKSADAFISIHHNTNSNTSISGTITYYYTNTDKKLASIIQKELIKKNQLKDLKARYGNYFVLRENPKLAILVELAFISNYSDELKARSKQFQESSAEGLFEGIIKYFD